MRRGGGGGGEMRGGGAVFDEYAYSESMLIPLKLAIS